MRRIGLILLATVVLVWAVLAITVVYALILPILWLIPKNLVATPDGKSSKADEA